MPQAPKGKGGHAIAKIEINKEMSTEQGKKLLETLKSRFEKNMNRHKGIDWSKVQAKLEASTEKLKSLNAMEMTGGEPDVIAQDNKTGDYLFYDCSKETPSGRRNICYDRAGQDTREKQGIHPAGNAIDLAASMGIELLTEEQYRELQKLGEFDLGTSSWVKTPTDIRKLGGGLFADRRFNTVFIYHNGANSFYSGRGFRGSLSV